MYDDAFREVFSNASNCLLTDTAGKETVDKTTRLLARWGVMIPDGRGSKMLPIQVGVGFRKALQLQIASFQLALQTSFAKDSQCKVFDAEWTCCVTLNDDIWHTGSEVWYDDAQ